MTENMKLIMQKVRGHIMTGNSANTPPVSVKPKPRPAPPEPEKEVAHPQSRRANSVQWPTDDDIPY